MKNDTPQDYKGPTLEIIARDVKQEPVPDFVKRVINKVPTSVNSVGTFLKDKIDGELTQTVYDTFEKSHKAKLVEMSGFVAQACRVKLDCEQKNMLTASKFTEWTYKRITTEIENIIEDDKKVKHSNVQNKIERLLEDS